MVLHDKEGNVYVIHFHHYKMGSPRDPYHRGGRLAGRMATMCSVHPAKCDTPMSKQRCSDCNGLLEAGVPHLPCDKARESCLGLSVCNPTDIFIKAEGRKRSLKRALQTFARDLRRELWTSYLEQSKPKPSRLKAA